MAGKRWTDAEIDFIEDNHQNLSDDEIADKLNDRSKNAIAQKRRQIGLYHRQKREEWSNEEIQYLKENTKSPISELAEELDRSEEAVKSKKSKIGATVDRTWSDEETEFIEKTYGVWEASEIADYLSKTKDQVYNKAKTENLTRDSPESWTEHEEEFLQRMNPIWKDEKIAEYLGRGHRSIASKKHRSDLTPGHWTESEEQHIVENFPEVSDKELAEDLDRTVRAVKNRRRRKLGLIRPGMLEDTIWRPWEKLCIEIAEKLYDGVEEKPELENGGIPDIGCGDRIFEVKKSPFSHRVDEDVEQYRGFCSHLEFWCLYGRRSFEEPDVRAVTFEELKDRIRGSSLDDSEVKRLFRLMEKCRDGVNPFN